jgi:uncharacterized protein YprB with RNaseH-like and TPR domain
MKFDVFFDDLKPVQREEEHSARPAGRRPVRGLPDGRWVEDGVYRMESEREIGSRHGTRPLDCPDRLPIMKNFGATDRACFLDLETTGLAGGTGTYAFLCGIGYTSGDSFKVVQFFLEGPAREARWLAAIDAEIPDGACLVTYNGRAFDIPLLRTRHILARSSPRWDASPHIDLLHYSRKLYRGYLESCSLGSMEKRVLGVERGGQDIPGYMIPAMYVQYLRSGDASPLGGVFYHNELDIVSLAALYVRVARVMSGDSADGRELLRAGDVWHEMGRHDMSDRLWNMAIEKPVTRLDAHARRAFRAKRLGDFTAAREEFESVLSGMRADNARAVGGTAFYMALEELAKLEEHRFRSPEAALRHVDEALAWLTSNRFFLGRAGSAMRTDMLRRRERLEKKINKHGRI